MNTQILMRKPEPMRFAWLCILLAALLFVVGIVCCAGCSTTRFDVTKADGTHVHGSTSQIFQNVSTHVEHGTNGVTTVDVKRSGPTGADALKALQTISEFAK